MTVIEALRALVETGVPFRFYPSPEYPFYVEVLGVPFERFEKVAEEATTSEALLRRVCGEIREFEESI